MAAVGQIRRTARSQLSLLAAFLAVDDVLMRMGVRVCAAFPFPRDSHEAAQQDTRLHTTHSPFALLMFVLSAEYYAVAF